MLSILTHDRIFTIVLARPEKRNALNRAMADALVDAFDQAARSDAKVIVLRAEGKAFSAGADLDALQALQSASYDDNLADSAATAAIFDAMLRHPKPIVSLIQGDAIAGGCGLATTADISIAVDTARFGYTETSIGFVPAIVSGILQRKVGDTQARRLLLGAERISAQEAQRIGLVTEVVPEADLDSRGLWWAQRFVNDLSATALARTKGLLAAQIGLSLERQMALAIESNAQARGDADCREGVRRFLGNETQRW
jgi:methylglutaconyl-CoA hydratase